MDDLMTWLRQQLDVDASNVEASIAGTIRHLRPAPVTRDEILSHNGSLRRELAEVDAKRRIMEIHGRRADLFPSLAGGSFDNCCDGCGFEGICDDPVTEDINDCPILRALALPYADRPGYRDEWKPEA